MIDLSKNTLQKPYTWVFPRDPAIDIPVDEDGNEDIKKLREIYDRYLDGTAELPLKSGQQPTLWELRHLSEREKREVNYYATQGNAHAAYFAVALALVAAVQPDGRFELERRRDERGFVRVTDEYMDKIGQVPWLIEEMANRIVQTLAPPGNS